jgi:hypothetical protein
LFGFGWLTGLHKNLQLCKNEQRLNYRRYYTKVIPGPIDSGMTGAGSRKSTS